MDQGMTLAPRTWEQDRYTVSTDRERLSLAEAHALLQTTFWGPQTPLELFTKAAHHSVCFGLYDGSRLIGFGRVVTDFATYGYWADVVTDPAYRGQGLGQWLCECMLAHPDLQGFRRIGLLTRDAVPLYTRLGFGGDLGTLHYMERRNPGEGAAIDRGSP